MIFKRWFDVLVYTTAARTRKVQDKRSKREGKKAWTNKSASEANKEPCTEARSDLSTERHWHRRETLDGRAVRQGRYFSCAGVYLTAFPLPHSRSTRHGAPLEQNGRLKLELAAQRDINAR